MSQNGHKSGQNSDPLSYEIFVDTDHASCPYTRKSTTGCVFKLTGPITDVTVHCGAQMQKNVSRSSGAAVCGGISDTVREMLQEINDGSDGLHGTCTVLARHGVSFLGLAEALDLMTEDSPRTLHTDANVAKIAITKGYSKVMGHLTKTQGVDLAWLKEAIATLSMQLTLLSRRAPPAKIVWATWASEPGRHF